MNSTAGCTAVLILAGCSICSFAFGAGSHTPVDSSATCLARSELIALKASRSLLGEMALTLHLSAEGRTTDQYTTTLLQQAAEELRSSQNALSSRKNIADLLDEALAGMAAHDFEKLHEIAAKLISIETSNEQCS
jgi:hypothetical protein